MRRFIEEWRILVPEIQQTQKVQTGHSQFTNLQFPFDVWSTLARPMLSYSELAMNPSSVDLSLGSLDRLSNELIDEIISFLLPTRKECDYVSPSALAGRMFTQRMLARQDTLALGLASQRLWVLVLRHVHISHIDAAAPWASKKICYQSSFCFDLPAPFEQDGLAKHILGSDWAPETSIGWYFWRKHTSYTRPTTVKEEQDLWTQALVQAMRIKKSASRSVTEKADKKRKRIEIDPEQLNSRAAEERYEILEKQLRGPELFPRNRVWVLRNLTSREVVFSEDQTSSRGRELLGLRSRSKRLKMEKDTGEFFNFLVLMRIAWTNEWRRGGDPVRGKWAGNRLEIVEKGVHDEGAGGWSDVTSEVEEEARELRKKLRI